MLRAILSTFCQSSNRPRNNPIVSVQALHAQQEIHQRQRILASSRAAMELQARAALVIIQRQHAVAGGVFQLSLPAYLVAVHLSGRRHAEGGCHAVVEKLGGYLSVKTVVPVWKHSGGVSAVDDIVVGVGRGPEEVVTTPARDGDVRIAADDV